MDDERKPNALAEPVTRAADERLVRIEHRLAEIAKSGEQRVTVLRDAVADYTAAEWAKIEVCWQIATLKKQIVDFERQIEKTMAVDQQVAEIARGCGVNGPVKSAGGQLKLAGENPVRLSTLTEFPPCRSSRPRYAFFPA
jgi:hypothetical protein